MKDKIQNEYYRRVRKLTLSKLNGGNTIRAIDRRAVLLVRSSAGVLKWTKDELKVMEEFEEPVSIAKNQKKKEKQIDGKFVLQTEEVRSEEIWELIRIDYFLFFK